MKFARTKDNYIQISSDHRYVIFKPDGKPMGNWKPGGYGSHLAKSEFDEAVKLSLKWAKENPST